MNRAERRRRKRFWNSAEPFEMVDPDHQLHAQGFPCVYCGSRTVIGDDLVYRCGCGWSGVLVWAAS